VSAGDLRVALPEGWTPVHKGPAVPGFAGARTAFARSYDADIAIALLPAQRLSLLPRELGAAPNPASAKPGIVRAGAARGYDYVRPAKNHRVLDVIAVPTTQGIATIACSSTVVAPGECAQALHGLHLTKGSFLPLGADSAFLARLPGATKTLDAQRLRLRTRLARASLAGGAALTAARLSRAYATAYRALRPVAAPRGEPAATVTLLDRLHFRYRRLAVAVRVGDRAAFKAIAGGIGRDEAKLAARLQAWQRALRAGSG
jgi:hypothetical protein